jgi:SAM-dependent methyltransferase
MIESSLLTGSFSYFAYSFQKGDFQMDERYFDAMLNIKTSGNQKGFNQSMHYYRYEPTPYSALEILFQKYDMNSSDRIVDFGCGKGRLNFYIHHRFNATVVGIEMNNAFFMNAMENCKSYLRKQKQGQNKIFIHQCLAEEYEISPFDNHFYFFNPFSIHIFTKVVNRILLSAECTEREITLILYYPSEDYIFYLDNNTPFHLQQEIILPEQYEHNQNERFLIYRLG